jgi:cell pole-organizing protein PopZ
MREPDPVDEGTMEEMRASIRRAISAMACEPLQGSAGTAAEPFSDGEHEPGGGTTYEATDIMIDLPIAQAMGNAEAEGHAEATAAMAEAREELARPSASALPTHASNARPPAPVDELGPALAEERSRSKPPLLSPSTDAMRGVFNQLATTMPRSGSARTIEDLVEDMLRPMLGSWLDVNLPPLVEKLVRQEIERLSRKSG